MNIKAIIASLVLGSSSLAVAAPAVTVVRDHQVTVQAPVTARVYVRPAPVFTPAQPVYTRPVAQNPGWWRTPVADRPVTLASVTGRYATGACHQPGFCATGRVYTGCAAGRVYTGCAMGRV